MSERLKKLLSMLEKSPNDAFLLYGAGIEHKNAGDHSSALKFMDRTLEVDPGYCYAYFQKGQIQEMTGDTVRAKIAYEEGIVASRKKGDAHAESEISGALQMLD